MEENTTFKMTYSAEQQEEIKKIRDKYLTPEEDKVDQLRAMDDAVSRKAAMVSISVGTVGTILMGLGMSLVMTDFGSVFGSFALPAGIVLGVIGIGILAFAYPLNHRILKQERGKIAPEILRLSEELMK